MWFAAGVVVWLLVTSFSVMMAIAALVEDNLPWYFKVGPMISAVVWLGGGLVGITLAFREARKGS